MRKRQRWAKTTQQHTTQRASKPPSMHVHQPESWSQTPMHPTRPICTSLPKLCLQVHSQLPAKTSALGTQALRRVPFQQPSAARASRISSAGNQQATCAQGDQRASSPPLLAKQRYIVDPLPCAPSQTQPLTRQPVPWLLLLLLRQPPWPAQLLLLLPQPTQLLLIQQCRQAPLCPSPPRELPRPMPQAHPVSAC